MPIIKYKPPPQVKEPAQHVDKLSGKPIPDKFAIGQASPGRMKAMKRRVGRSK